jgi:hypothetical protein
MKWFLFIGWMWKLDGWPGTFFTPCTQNQLPVDECSLRKIAKQGLAMRSRGFACLIDFLLGRIRRAKYVLAYSYYGVDS